MHCSGTILAWGILYSARLALAESHVKGINHVHRLASQAKRSLSDQRYAYPDGAASTSNDGYYQTTATPACDATQPKFGINKVLINHNRQLGDISASVMDLTSQVDGTNTQEMAGQIAAQLQKIVAAFKFCLSSVQLCGTDPKPLSSNNGISLSDVSWSTLQIVLTLKTIFESVSSLYEPFPIIKKTCSDTLISLSTALASLIGACSEQLNLFDTRFFPLVTPQLKEFMDVDDNFSSFFGSFVAT